MLPDAARRWRSWKMTKRDHVVASIRHHRTLLLKCYPRLPCAPIFVKSRMLCPLQTHFLLFQQIFLVLGCIHPGNIRAPTRLSKQEKSHFHIFIYCLINGQNRNAIVNRPMARILKSYSMSGQPVLKDGEAR